MKSFWPPDKYSGSFRAFLFTTTAKIDEVITLDTLFSKSGCQQVVSHSNRTSRTLPLDELAGKQ